MNNLLKSILNGIFILLVSPLIVLTRLVNTNSFFSSCAQFLSLIPGKCGVYARRSYFHFTMQSCSLDCCIVFGTVFSQRETEIGENVYIGAQCNIGKCRIEKNTLLGSGVHILSGKRQHNFESVDTPIQQQGGEFKKITVGEDSWLGNGSIIMANIGKHCVVAAGSVVTKDIEDYSIAAGNPATLVRSRR